MQQKWKVVFRLKNIFELDPFILCTLGLVSLCWMVKTMAHKVLPSAHLICWPPNYLAIILALLVEDWRYEKWERILFVSEPTMKKNGSTATMTYFRANCHHSHLCSRPRNLSCNPSHLSYIDPRHFAEEAWEACEIERGGRNHSYQIGRWSYLHCWGLHYLRISFYRQSNRDHICYLAYRPGASSNTKRLNGEFMSTINVA